MEPARHAVLVTCEHASHAVPPALRQKLRLSTARLASHRGFDRGARGLARTLATRLGAPLVLGRITRLVVDLNRSPHNPAVFSRVTRGLGPSERGELLASWHTPHWEVVRLLVDEALMEGDRVVHLAAHSFAPTLGGKRRNFDVGLLYDPARAPEVALVEAWRGALGTAAPWMRVRLNAPYRGVSDGLATALRKRYGAGRYAGIEVEVNQALLTRPARWRRARLALAETASAFLRDGREPAPMA